MLILDFHAQNLMQETILLGKARQGSDDLQPSQGGEQILEKFDQS